jgi:hypothetical protein
MLTITPEVTEKTFTGTKRRYKPWNACRNPLRATVEWEAPQPQKCFRHQPELAPKTSRTLAPQLH